MRNVSKNFNVFVDGKGYAGEADEFTPPKLALKTEEHRAGGMNAPVKLTMGMEAMDADFTLTSVDPHTLARFGVTENASVQLTVREALESHDGTVTPAVHSLRGKITEVDQGNKKVGEKGSQKVTLSLDYYKHTIGGVVTQEIDIVNMVHKSNGVDLLEALRTAIGI